MMKKLTATLCLTVAVLLGSVGVCWSQEIIGFKPEEQKLLEAIEKNKSRAEKLVEKKGWKIGVNGRKGKEFLVSTGSGNTFLGAFCDAVVNSAKYLSTNVKKGVFTSAPVLFSSKFEITSKSIIATEYSTEGIRFSKFLEQTYIKSPNGQLSCERRSSSKGKKSNEKTKNYIECKKLD